MVKINKTMSFRISTKTHGFVNQCSRIDLTFARSAEDRSRRQIIVNKYIYIKYYLLKR